MRRASALVWGRGPTFAWATPCRRLTSRLSAHVQLASCPGSVSRAAPAAGAQRGGPLYLAPTAQPPTRAVRRPLGPGTHLAQAARVARLGAAGEGARGVSSGAARALPPTPRHKDPGRPVPAVGPLLGGAPLPPTSLPRLRTATYLVSPPANFSTARLATLDTKLPISPRGARDLPRSGCLPPAVAPTRGARRQRVRQGVVRAPQGEGGVPRRRAAGKRGCTGAHLGPCRPRSRQIPPAGEPAVCARRIVSQALWGGGARRKECAACAGHGTRQTPHPRGAP